MEDLAYFNEKEYIEGFNLGYKLSNDFPELAELIYSANGKSNKLEGLKDGRQQYLEDKLIEKNLETKAVGTNHNLPDFLKNNRFDKIDLDQEQNLDRDMDKED